MVKPEWGAKRSCPKCGTRFYDLTNDDPVTCIACGNAWVPEPILKSKQPLPFEEAAKQEAKAEEADLEAEALDLEEEGAEEEDVDIGGDDEDITAVAGRDQEEES